MLPRSGADDEAHPSPAELEFAEALRAVTRQAIVQHLADQATSGVERPTVEKLVLALRRLMSKGLPATPQTTDDLLVRACAANTGPRSATLMVDSLVTRLLMEFEVEKWAPAARILFSVEPGIQKRLTLTERRARAAETLPGNRRQTSKGWEQSTMNADHFRNHVEPEILTILALQIIRVGWP